MQYTLASASGRARCGNPQNECENFASVLIKFCERAMPCQARQTETPLFWPEFDANYLGSEQRGETENTGEENPSRIMENRKRELEERKGEAVLR